MDVAGKRVALVHHWLVRRRGGETTLTERTTPGPRLLCHPCDLAALGSINLIECIHDAAEPGVI